LFCFANLKLTRPLNNGKKLVSTAYAKICGLSISMVLLLQTLVAESSLRFTADNFLAGILPKQVLRSVLAKAFLLLTDSRK
jgi:hypothetical protein